MKIMKNVQLSLLYLFLWSFMITAISCNKNSKDTQQLKEIRIGVQKSGPLLFLRNKKILEDYYAKEGVKITWTDFSSGPPMLEALNTGSIDFCTTGDTPPIFAQAAGVGFYYIAAEPLSTGAETLIVPNNSSIKTLHDIKGKKIAVTRGSSAHYTLTKVLEKTGYNYSDIVPVYLSPSDARAAFESGNIDAWVIWEPFLSAAEIQLNAKIIDPDIRPYIWLYLSSKDFAEQHPEKIDQLIENIKIADEKIYKDLDAFADILTQSTGIDKEISIAAVKRHGYGVQLIDDNMIDHLQNEANSFYQLKLIPKNINIKDNVWKNKQTNQQ